MSTGHPLAKAALMQLAEAWPKALWFDELLALVQARLGPASAGGDEEPGRALALGDIILATYAAGMVDLHLHVPPWVLEVSERPVASPLARVYLERGSLVTTMRHTMVRMEGSLERHLLLLLDGTRDRTALLDALAALVGSGAVPLEHDGGSITDREQARHVLSQGLGPTLSKLAHLGLLVG
jgi:hypothetical protein